MDPTSSPPAASMPSRAASERSDEELLQAAGAEPEAFAMFYRRDVRALSAYFWRRSRDAETTADLTAETFAAALDGCASALSAPRTSRPPRPPWSSSGSVRPPPALIAATFAAAWRSPPRQLRRT